METFTIVMLVILLLLVFMVLGLAYLIFWIFMLVDCVNRPFEKKLRWLLLINLVPFGVLFYYFMVKRKGRADKKQPRGEIETLSLVAFILGILSFKVFIYFGLILGPIAIIFAVMAQKKFKNDPKLNGKALASCGLVLGIIGAVLQVIVIILYFSLIGFVLLAGSELEKTDAGAGETIEDYLDVGMTMTYTLNGVDYEISAERAGSKGVMMSINGEDTPWISINGKHTLPDGSSLTVNDIDTYEGEETIYFTLTSG